MINELRSEDGRCTNSSQNQRLGSFDIHALALNPKQILCLRNEFSCVSIGTQAQPLGGGHLKTNPTNFCFDGAIKVKPQLINVMGKYVFMCFLLLRRVQMKIFAYAPSVKLDLFGSSSAHCVYSFYLLDLFGVAWPSRKVSTLIKPLLSIYLT